MSKTEHPVRIERQNGSVLIVGLIMLLVITLISLAAIQSTTLQERMAGNMRDRNQAFQAAEMALRQGETLVAPGTAIGTGNGWFDITGTKAPGNLVDYAVWEIAGNVMDFGVVYGSAVNPKYMVERQPNLSGPSLEAGVEKTLEVFKVSSVGIGGSTDAVVVLQSSFKR